MKPINFLKLCLLLFTLPCFAKVFVPYGNVKTQFKAKSEKEKLFNFVGREYMNFVEIIFSEFDQLDPKNTKHYLESAITIDQNSKKYYDQVLAQELAPMYLKWISADIGYGVFAREDINSGQLIGLYSGQLRVMRSINEKPVEDVDYAWYYPINAPSGKRLLVDAKVRGNELCFINHAKDPNTSCIDVLIDNVFYLVYVANRFIPKNYELTVSYGDGYWDSRAINPA
jgi:hypothetical protein